MFNFRDWRPDRYVRFFLGLGFVVLSVLFYSAGFAALFLAGAALIFTAVNGRCPFNACAVKEPVKEKVRKD